MGDERRLLGRFGQNGIASCQSCADLAGEDREWEVPGADAGPDASSLQALACRDGLGGVVAQEIDRFTNLVDRVSKRLACLTGEKAENLG